MPLFIRQLLPFFMFGIVLAILFFGAILLAHLLLVGAVIGLVLFLIGFIKQKFFPPKHPRKSKPSSGRIIDSTDWKEL